MPVRLPWVNSVNPSGKSLIDRLSRSTKDSPRYTLSVPTVTISDGRPITTEKKALIRPAKPPTAIASTKAPASPKPDSMARPKITPVSPKIEATERSISPAIISHIIGSTIRPVPVARAAVIAKLSAVRKNGDTSDPPTRATITRTSKDSSQIPIQPDSANERLVIMNPEDWLAGMEVSCSSYRRPCMNRARVDRRHNRFADRSGPAVPCRLTRLRKARQMADWSWPQSYFGAMGRRLVGPGCFGRLSTIDLT